VCKEERRRRINTRYKSVPIPCIGHQPWRDCIAGIDLWRSTCIQKEVTASTCLLSNSAPRS
jgi:hypothetical protein